MTAFARVKEHTGRATADFLCGFVCEQLHRELASEFKEKTGVELGPYTLVLIDHATARAVPILPDAGLGDGDIIWW